MVLKIFICPSHIANWIPGALESMGRDRHPIRALWVFPLPIIDIWNMQIWIYQKMCISKDQILTKILHRSQWEMPTRRQERYLNVIHIIRYENNTLQQLSASTCFKTIVALCIQSRSSVNRDKDMGTGLEKVWIELAKLKQQSSKGLNRLKLMIDWLSVNTQNRSGSWNSQLNQNKKHSDQLFYTRGGF